MTDQTNDTKYHDLTLPAAGYDAADPSWDELLNSAFDGIDARLELRGTLAERPSTAPDGAKYVVDDPDDEHDGERFVYRAATDAWELRPGKFSAVATDETAIKNNLHHAPHTEVTGEVNTIDLATNTPPTFVDNDPDSPHTGRAYHSDYYWDAPYDTRNALPDNQNGQPGTPNGFPHVVAVSNGYIFCITGSPLEIKRSSNPSDYSSGSFNWATVLTGQSGSSYLTKQTPYNGGVEVNRDTGTICVAERNSDGDDRVFRSTDDGTSWTEVFSVPTAQDHTHALRADPYESGHWLLSMGDQGSEPLYAESTDDGKTWTTTDKFAFTGDSQAVEMDFDSERIYFSQDQGVYDHGPWYYDRDTGETGLVFSEHPKNTFARYADNPLEYSIFVDDDSPATIIYGLMDDRGNGKSVLYYGVGIGDRPKQLHAGVADNILKFAPDYMLTAENAYPRLSAGGREL